MRRALCDISLHVFQLVLSGVTFDCVDMSVASKVLKWNLKRYPNGIKNAVIIQRVHSLSTFSFSLGRHILPFRCRSSISLSCSTRTSYQILNTVKPYTQSQCRNQHHISYWKMAIEHLALWDVKSGLACWTELKKESTVSHI